MFHVRLLGVDSSLGVQQFVCIYVLYIQVILVTIPCFRANCHNFVSSRSAGNTSRFLLGYLNSRSLLVFMGISRSSHIHIGLIVLER